MQLNNLLFPAPKSTYTQVQISLLPNTELLSIPSGTFQACLECGPPKTRLVPTLVVKNTNNPTSNKYLMFFHSNSEDIYNCYGYLNPIVQETNCNLILIEYPGYGIYTSQSTTAELILEDAKSVYEYFIYKRRLQQSDIAVMGRSIGCGPACFLASTQSPAALITISAYTSIKEVADHLVGSILGKLVQDRFNNVSIIQNVKAPFLVIHGLKDEFIPFCHSKQLICLSKSRIKQFHFSENMTHNEFDIQYDILIPIKQFLTKINFQNIQQEQKQFDHKHFFKQKVKSVDLRR